MRIVTPGETVQLWTIYQENGVTLTGQTDLSVTVTDSEEGLVLSETGLVESGSVYYEAIYYYNWDTSSVSLGKSVKAMYKKDEEVLFSEEFLFDIIEDQDGQML